MVHVAEACAECTQNCLLMHKKDKNPSPVATTFFKVMFGDDYSKVLFLPPKFARSVRNKVGKTSWLEDSSGEKWIVKFTLIDDLLAFEEGWNAFSTAHGLKEGDLLVFHYIMESHFVVLMYGQSGCPEIQHFGFNRPQVKETRKKQRLITDNNKPSNVNTDDHHHLSESERSDYEHLEIRQSVRTQHKDKRIKKKETVVQVPPSVNAKNTCNQPRMKDTRKRQKLITYNSKPSNVNTDDHHHLSESEGSDYGHLQVRQSLGTQQHKAERIKKKETVVQVPPPSMKAKNTCNQPQMKDTLKKQRLITDNIKPSNVNSDYHHLSDSSESEHSEYEHLGIRHSVGTQHKDERIKKKGTVVKEPPSVNAKNAYNRLFASSSRPGPSVSGKEVVRDENRENMVSKTPPTGKQLCLVDNDIVHVDDDLSIPEVTPSKSDDCQKNKVVVGGGGNETQMKKCLKILETQSKESKEDHKKQTIMPSEVTCNTSSINKRLRGSDLPIARPKMAKIEAAGASGTDTPAPGSNLRDAVRPSPSTGIFPKSIPKLMKVTKKELPSNNGSDEFEMKDTKKALLHNSRAEVDNNSFVKVEPVDYDEALPPGPTNSLFSAVMSSYQYLELPEWVKLKKVILLRSGGDLWPVLFQNQLGIKALTQSWEAFARERGIQLGDNCEFVLESEPNPDMPCSVFRVQVTAK